MAPPTTRYKSVPRTAEETYDVIEEIAPSPSHSNSNVRSRFMLHELGLQGDSYETVTFSAIPFSGLILIASVLLSLATLIIQAYRLELGMRLGHTRYRDGMREFIVPVLAFCSFDVLIHSIVLIYFLLKRFCHVALVSTRPISLKQGYELPTVFISLKYLVEVFTVIMLFFGLLLDLRYTYRIPSRQAAQICGWIAL